MLKITQVVTKATKHHKDREEKHAHHRINSVFENELRHLWMISEDPQSYVVTKKLDAKDSCFFFNF